MRVVFAACLVVSAALHGSMVPLRLPGPVEVHDFEGEAAIPIDILEQGEPAVEAPPVVQSPEAPQPQSPGEGSKAMAADAGVARDAASLADAGIDGAPDAQGQPDAGEPTLGDGGAGPADPQALLDSSGAVQGDVVFVTVVINVIEIRKNPAAGQLGEILWSIPEWYDFMHGTEGLIDPVGDSDWILVSGPGLIDSSADAVTLHYSTSDGTVDRAAQIVSQRTHGGPLDVGVPGVRAWRAHADRADRVILRPRSHVLVIVPPKRATSVAKQLVHAKAMPKNIMPGVAAFIRVRDPHHVLPTVIPEGTLEARLRVRSREDGGADVEIDADCKDESTASRGAEQVARFIRQSNTFTVSLGTGGLLNRAEVGSEGKQIHIRVPATREQIQTTLASLQLFLPSLTGGPPPGPRPSSTGASAPHP